MGGQVATGLIIRRPMGGVGKFFTVNEIAHDLSYYVGNEAEFPILREWDFFNHAGVSPLPRVAGEALRAFARQYEERAYLESGFYREIEALRISAAAMIGAEREE